MSTITVDNTKELITSQKHVNEISIRLYELLQRNMHCDVDIIVGGQTFPVHKIVMISTSEYFNDLTWKQRNNCRQNVKVTLNNVDADAMQWVIYYCYTGKVELTIGNVETIINVAGFLLVSDLLEICLNFYEKHISVSNCLRILTLAHLYDKSNSWDTALSFTCKNFSKVVNDSSFLDVDSEILFKVLSSDNIDTCSEEDVFKSLKRWVEHDREGRSSYVASLLKAIKLPLLDSRFILSEVQPMCDNDNNCRKIIIDALNSKLIKGSQSQQFHQRKCPIVALVTGGRGESYSSTVEIYDPFENSWRKFFEIDSFETVTEYAAVLVKNNLILLGGWGPNGPISRVLSINLKTRQTTNLPSLSTKRSEARAVELDGHLYVIGGFSGGLQISTMEVFNIDKNSWSFGPSMYVNRGGFGLTVLDGKIYAVGGHNENGGLDTVEVFSPNTNEWKSCKTLNKARNYVEVVAFGGYVYAFGGYSGIEHSNNLVFHDDVERYEPSTDTWTAITNFTSPRARVGACVINENIIIVGGYDGSATIADVNKYDPKTNKWENYKHPEIQRQNPRVLVIPQNISI